MRMNLLVGLVALLLPGCGNAVSADWFRCENLDCTALAAEGIRMNGDGTLQALFAESGDPTAGYCSRPWSGTWENEEDLYFFIWVDGVETRSQSALLIFDGDFVYVGSAQDSTRYRAVGPLEFRDCESDPGGPPPAFEVPQ